MQEVEVYLPAILQSDPLSNSESSAEWPHGTVLHCTVLHCTALYCIAHVSPRGLLNLDWARGGSHDKTWARPQPLPPNLSLSNKLDNCIINYLIIIINYLIQTTNIIMYIVTIMQCYLTVV